MRCLSGLIDWVGGIGTDSREVMTAVYVVEEEFEEVV